MSSPSATTPNPDYWRRCNICKKPIPYTTRYWVCNVSTCNRKRTGMVFCDVACWDAHVPVMNHRESWAEERRSPSKDEWAKVLSGEEPVKRRERAPAPMEKPATPVQPATPKVILRRPGSK